MFGDQKASLFTLATSNYISQAIVALKSASEFNTFEKVYLFIVDLDIVGIGKIQEELNNSNLDWIAVFGPNDLEEENKKILCNSFAYFNNIEVCCLAKFLGLSHLSNITDASDACVFIDADTYFFNNLDVVFEEIKDKAILLTPHNIGPTTDEVEHMSLMHGWINAGFIVINNEHPKHKVILNWLINRISRRGYFAPEYGLSCDQTWISLVPLAFDESVVISKHKGLNVAYWNIDYRLLSKSKNDYYAGDSLLIFFHFSGFKDLSKLLLSKHSIIKLQKNSPLYEICEKYDSDIRSLTMFDDVKFENKILFSEKSLLKRMKIGFNYFGIVNTFSAEMPGFFGWIGLKFDSLFRKFFHC